MPACLLLIGAILHSYDTITLLSAGSETQVWSHGAALAAALIAVLNLLCRNRDDDRALWLTTAVASLLWACVALGFGHAIGNIADPRVIWHAVCGVALAGIGFAHLRAA